MLSMALDGAMELLEGGGLLVDGPTDTDPIGAGDADGGTAPALVLGALTRKRVSAPRHKCSS